jgi:hypothetical protein
MTDSLKVINHMRQISADQFHRALDTLRWKHAGHYIIITNWLMSLRPEPKFSSNNLTGAKAGGECPIRQDSGQNNPNT